MKGFQINGEFVTAKEAFDLMKMLYSDAKQVAGEFHGMNRSPKFRANWPDETLFAECEWKNFVEATRMMYVARLADPKTSPADGRRMSLALILQAMMAVGSETDNRIQIAPNTQQFEGDKYENKKIIEKFGGTRNLRAVLRQGAAKINSVH